MSKPGAVALLCLLGVGAAGIHFWRPDPLADLSPARRARLEREAKKGAPEAAFSEPDLAQAFYVNKRTGPIETRGPNPTTGSRTLDPARYLPALAQMRAMPRYDSGTGTMLPPRADGDPVTDELLGNWSSLGPANQGGRTRGLLVDPSNASVMYAGGVAGGVWKSTDGGSSWVPLTDLMANIAISTLAFDPQNSSVIYAGTGEGFFNADAVRGAGIFRTTNAGATWAQIASTNTTNFHFTNRVIVSPRNSQRIFAATRTGLFRSIDGGTSWSGLAVTANNGCTDMAMQVVGPSGFLFVSCGTFAQGTVYRVPDTDTGTPESVLSLAGQGRSAIAVAPSDESVVYVMAAQATAGAGPGQHGLHGVYRSTAHGALGTFTTQRQGNVAPTSVAQRINQLLLSNPVFGLLADCGFGSTQLLNQGWYDNVLAVDPVDPNRVWAGGIDLWRSDNGGVDWGTAGFWWFDRGSDPEYHHADQHAIVFHPGYNGTSNTIMFAGSDGGVDRIDDARAPVNTTLTQLCGAPVAGGGAWIDRSNGYVTTQFYHGAVYPNGATYFGGLQDNGTQRGATTSANWSALLGGDGGYVAVDTLGDGNAGNDVLFGEFTRLSIQRSTNGGATFANAFSGITESSGNFLFIAPFTMNQGVKQQLWTGGAFLWRTINQATSWTQASALTAGSGSVSTVAVHPLDGNRVLVGMSDGFILLNHSALSASSATTWANTRPATSFISSVAWDPANTNVAYATVSNFVAATVFKSTNGGASWTATMGSGGTALPAIPALSVVVNPADPQHVFVGTDLGVFVSIDGGASWMLENTGFANTPVESLSFNETAPRQLYAFTHGRGAWRVPLQAGCPTITVAPATLPNGSVGAAYSQTITASGGTAPYTFAVTSGTLPTGLTLSAGGTLNGTPTAAAVFGFTVTATASGGCTGAQAYTVTVSGGLLPTTTTVTFEPGPYVYRGTPFTATAVATGTGLNQPLAVTYSGNCTIPTTTNGCTASAAFAGSATHLPSSDSRSITILQPTDAQPATQFRVDSIVGNLVRFRWISPQFGPPPTSFFLEGGLAPNQVLASLPTNSASPVFDVVVPSGSWFARLRTASGTSLSGNSNEVLLHVGVPVAPSAPTGLTGLVNGSVLGLSWINTFEGGAPSGTVLDVTGSFVGSVPFGPGESFDFAGVPGGTYTFRVRATNAGGSSPATAPLTLTFPGGCSGPPGTPTDFLFYRVGSTVTVLLDPATTGPATSSFVLNVSGAFVGSIPLGARQISAPVGSGSYTVAVSGVNACGISPATAAQTVVVP